MQRKRISLPLSRRPLPNLYDKEKLIKIYDNMDNVVVMMACFLGDVLGLRISEVCNLKDINVNLEEKYVKLVQGKGRKDRIILIVNPIWLPILRKWKRIRGVSEYFIPSLQKIDGKTQNNCKMSIQSLMAHHKEILKKVDLYIVLKKKSNGGGIVPMYSFHTHRHTYATNMLRWGFELSMVQQQLGHTDIAITMRYNELTKAHIHERANKIFGKQEEPKIEMPQNVTDPLQLLKLRLASGEITLKKYNEVWETLQSNQNVEKEDVGYIG